jgi:hypothetical protein
MFEAHAVTTSSKPEFYVDLNKQLGGLLELSQFFLTDLFNARRFKLGGILFFAWA